MENKKPIIGILGSSSYMESDDCFFDNYSFSNNYIKAIYDNGGIPYLIPLIDDDVIKDTLNMCDGLLLPGGKRIKPVNFKVIDYFYKNNKPILGICMGMQTLAMYSVNLNGKERIIEPVEGHWPIDIKRDNSEVLVHSVNVLENSIMHDIFNRDVMEVNSVHNYCVNKVGSLFKVSIKSLDGVIEGIESVDPSKFIIGVQFHPEILKQYSNIFKVFINKCKK